MKSEAELAPQRQFSREFVERHFGPRSSSSAAAQLMREHPEEYRACRDQAIADGLLAADRQGPLERAVRHHHALQNPHFSQEEIECRALFAEDEVKSYLKGTREVPSDNLANLKKNDPTKFRQMMVAAKSFGYAVHVPEAGTKRTLVEELQNDGKIQISDELADDCHLVRGYRTMPENLSSIYELQARVHKIRAEMQAEKEDALKAQAEAAKSAEAGRDGSQ